MNIISITESPFKDILEFLTKNELVQTANKLRYELFIKQPSVSHEDSEKVFTALNATKTESILSVSNDPHTNKIFNNLLTKLSMKHTNSSIFTNNNRNPSIVNNQESVRNESQSITKLPFFGKLMDKVNFKMKTNNVHKSIISNIDCQVEHESEINELPTFGHSFKNTTPILYSSPGPERKKEAGPKANGLNDREQLNDSFGGLNVQSEDDPNSLDVHSNIEPGQNQTQAHSFDELDHILQPSHKNEDSLNEHEHEPHENGDNIQAVSNPGLNSSTHSKTKLHSNRPRSAKDVRNEINSPMLSPTLSPMNSNDMKDEEDEFMNDDDGGFRQVSVAKDEVTEKSKIIAQMHNFPDAIVDQADRHHKLKSKYEQIPKKHLLQDFLNQFQKNRPNEEITEELLAEYDLLPKHPKTSLLPFNAKIPNQPDEQYPIEVNNTVFDVFNLKIVQDREKTGFEDTKEFVMEEGRLVAGRQLQIDALGSAAFSKAQMCKDIFTDNLVCLKVINNNKDQVDQSIDEIKILRYLNLNGIPDQHYILKFYDFFQHQEHLIIITELLKDNLYELYKVNRELVSREEDSLYFTIGKLQRVSFQILAALDFIHSLHLVHCDLKPENILVKSISKCEIRVIDFGSSCFVQDHLSSQIQSRSQRAPEVILGCNQDYKIDIWSFGCIIAELWSGYVLFQNDTVQGLLARIVAIIGRIPRKFLEESRLMKEYFTDDLILFQPDSDEKDKSKDMVQLMIPKKSSLKARLKTGDHDFVHFVEHCLQIDPDERPTAKEAMKHKFFTKKQEDGLTESERDRLNQFLDNEKLQQHGE